MKEKKVLDVHVGLQIKKARESAGYTQERFAEVIGMGCKNVSAIERGMVGVSLTTVRKICKTLCISSDSLIMDEPDNINDERLAFLTERMKRLPQQQLGLVLDINNKLFEVFALQT